MSDDLNNYKEEASRLVAELLAQWPKVPLVLLPDSQRSLFLTPVSLTGDGSDIPVECSDLIARINFDIRAIEGLGAQVGVSFFAGVFMLTWIHTPTELIN